MLPRFDKASVDLLSFRLLHTPDEDVIQSLYDQIIGMSIIGIQINEKQSISTRDAGLSFDCGEDDPEYDG